MISFELRRWDFYWENRLIADLSKIDYNEWAATPFKLSEKFIFNEVVGGVG